MRPRTPLPLLAALLLSLLPAALAAQDAAAPPPPAAEPAPERWRAVLDLLLSGASGNQNLVVLTTGARLTHLETSRFEMELSGQARYGRSEGVDVARQLRGGWKVDLGPEARWSPFVFGTLEHDPFRRLRVRADGGGGVKYTLLRSETSELSLSGAGLYSYERVDARAAAADPLRTTARASWRAKGSHAFPGGLSVEQVTFYQPRLADAADYRLSAETALRARVGSVLSLKLLHSYERDSAPPAEVRRDDHRFEAGVSVGL